MMATRLSLTAGDALHDIRASIEAAVPHGRTDNGGANDRGAWFDVPGTCRARVAADRRRNDRITEKHPKALSNMGTLGTGNHFIELWTRRTGSG